MNKEFIPYEQALELKRTELYNSILSIVKQIPRKEVESDAIDAPSCAYELEQLFYKWQQKRMYSEGDKIMNFLNTEHELGISDKKTIERIKWYFETYFEQFKKK